MTYNIYLLILAIYDKIFGEDYQKFDYSWRNGNFCFILGIISGTSCLVSMFSLLVIILEKVFVVEGYMNHINVNFKFIIITITLNLIVSTGLTIFPYLFYEVNKKLKIYFDSLKHD